MAAKKETTKTTAPVPVTKAPPAVISNDLLARMAQDAGNGMEGTDRESFAIPFIRVLQQLSPQCTEGKTGYNPKARPGMIFNTVTGELIDGQEGIIFLPCAYQRRFIQWGPRGSSDNGGFKGEWLPEDAAAAISDGRVKKFDDGKYYFPNERGEINPKKCDYLADTRSHFGLVLTDNGPVQALLALSGSQIKKSKQLMGILSSIRIGGVEPPTWMTKIKVTTVQESNDQGSWYGVRVEAAGQIEDAETYDMGKSFHAAITRGAARAAYEHESDENSGADRDNGKF